MNLRSKKRPRRGFKTTETEAMAPLSGAVTIASAGLGSDRLRREFRQILKFLAQRGDDVVKVEAENDMIRSPLQPSDSGFVSYIPGVTKVTIYLRAAPEKPRQARAIKR